MTNVIKILVIDDEKDTKDLFAQIFNEQIKDGTYRLDFVSNMDALNDKFNSESFDIFISDININGKDCLGLVSELRKKFPLMRSIIISAYGDINTLRAVMRGGAHDFVIKPIDIKDLTTTVAKTSKVIMHLKENQATAQKLSAINDELDVSASLQKSILPGNVLKKGKVDLYADSAPAAEVGGDFYDFFWLDETKLGIVIADVSGKNISGAMFMTMASTLVKAFARMTRSPAECFRHVNETICMQNVTTRFVTAMYGIIDTETDILTYTNAGHLPIGVIRADSDTVFLDCDPGIALGIFDEAEFVDNTYNLKLGDTILMYTDGVTEAADPVGAEYDYERFTALLNESKKLPPKLLTKALIKSIKAFANGAEQSDDITTLCLKYRLMVSANVD